MTATHAAGHAPVDARADTGPDVTNPDAVSSDAVSTDAVCTDAVSTEVAPGSLPSPSGGHGPTPVGSTADTADRAFTIRLVRPEEYARAGEVTAEAYETSYGPLRGEYAASLRDVAGRVRDGDVWVAADADGDILGTVWVARANRPLASVARPGETDFRQLAVASAARGRGVGAALTAHVIELARRRGSHRVVMNSGPQMTGAHALYAKLGFRRLSEREGRIEVEPGRIIELLAFGYDVDPAPVASAAVGPVAVGPVAVRDPGTWHLEATTWDDPRAVGLRAEMDEELGSRYADLVAEFAARAARAEVDALAIDPATIVAVVLAIDEAGEAVGHVALREHRHDGTRDDEVKRLFVRDRVRGTGASRALLARAEQLAAERGARRVVLQTGERQQDAIALYRNLGYAPIPVYEPYALIPGSHCFAKSLPEHDGNPEPRRPRP